MRSSGTPSRLRTESPTVASLYSGCGGFDKGFESGGFRPLGAFDINPAAVDVYNRNIEPVARVLDLARNDPVLPRPDVLLAGSPCQGFSTSGKRIISDPRNRLLIRAGEIAVRIRPKVFILENVPAALSGKHRRHWEAVERMLRWHGYNVGRFVADGLESGLAQLRRRVFLIAWRGNDCVRIEPVPVPGRTLSDALRDVDRITDHDPIPLAPRSREAKIATHICQGQKLSNVRSSDAAVHTWEIPAVYGRATSREITVLENILGLRRRDRRRGFGDADPVTPRKIRHALGWDPESEIRNLIMKGYLRRIGRYVDLVHTYNGKFRRLTWEAPSPTVDTHFGDPTLFLHPDEDRGFTPREAARIQGFSDGFILTGTRSSRFRMIGNAVPPPMAARLAHFVRAALL